MLPNNSQEISSGNYIAVPATNNVPTPPVGQAPASYYHLSLLPAILMAATPLILGLMKKDKDDDDKE